MSSMSSGAHTFSMSPNAGRPEFFSGIGIVSGQQEKWEGGLPMEARDLHPDKTD